MTSTVIYVFSCISIYFSLCVNMQCIYFKLCNTCILPVNFKRKSFLLTTNTVNGFNWLSNSIINCNVMKEDPQANYLRIVLQWLTCATSC